MANYTGTSGDDEFLMNFVPVAGETYDGGDGTDTIVVDNGLESSSFLSSTLINFEILQFGIPRVLLSISQADQIDTLVGNDEQNSLIILATSGGTYQMPDFTLWNWTEGADYLLLFASGNLDTTLIARDGLATLQVLIGGTGSDTLIGSDGDDHMIGGNGLGADHHASGRYRALDQHPHHRPRSGDGLRVLSQENPSSGSDAKSNKQRLGPNRGPC